MASWAAIATGGPLGNANLQNTLKWGGLGAQISRQGSEWMWGSQATQPSPDVACLTVYLLDVKVETACLWAQSSLAQSNLINKNRTKLQYSSRARSHRDALTYGGKCVAQRRAQCASHAREISDAVAGSCQSFWMFAQLYVSLPVERKQRQLRQRLNGVFSVSLIDAYGCTVQCKLSQKSTDAAEK